MTSWAGTSTLSGGQQRDTPNPGCSDHLRTSPLTSLPPKLVRASAWDCSPLPPRPHPCPASQGLTHSLEELERGDSQKQEQVQELVHLGLGWRGDAEGAGAGEQSAREGRGQAALACRGEAWRPGLSCSWAVGRSFLLHPCQWAFHCHRGPGNVPTERHPPTPTLLKVEDVPGAPACSPEAAS